PLAPPARRARIRLRQPGRGIASFTTATSDKQRAHPGQGPAARRQGGIASPRSVLGDNPAFVIPGMARFSWKLYLFIVPVAALSGLIGVVFQKGALICETTSRITGAYLWRRSRQSELWSTGSATSWFF
ncbi:MAG TPA: hypothetical protein VN939_04670, partial [Chthoniobacterales bacterium]|nr:hypothetical protein [Chthoniobacterales bacterium]